MARIMTRSRPVKEGNTGVKFSEVLIMLMVVAVVAYGVKYYLDYKKSASYALSEFMGGVKAGNAEDQYKLIDELDKQKFFKTLSDYKKLTFPHGYTERVANVTLLPEEKDPKKEDFVTIKMNVSIRDTTVGKKIYENGTTNNYSDSVKMRKNSDGAWRLMLSKSVDPNTNKFSFEQAPPSPESVY